MEKWKKSCKNIFGDDSDRATAIYDEYRKRQPKGFTKEIFKLICEDNWETYWKKYWDKGLAKGFTKECRITGRKNNKRCEEYYTSRGYNLEDAKKLVRDYQLNNSGVHKKYWENKGLKKNEIENKEKDRKLKISRGVKGIPRSNIYKNFKKNNDISGYVNRRLSTTSNEKITKRFNVSEITQKFLELNLLSFENVNCYFNNIKNLKYKNAKGLYSPEYYFNFLIENEHFELLSNILAYPIRTDFYYVIEKLWKSKYVFDWLKINHPNKFKKITYEMVLNTSKCNHTKLINLTKIKDKSEASKESIKALIPLYRFLRKIGLESKDIYWGIRGGPNTEYRIYIQPDKNKTHYRYDFTVPKLNVIIEYDGEMYHNQNSKIFNMNGFIKDVDKFNEKEAHKETLARLEGFTIFRIKSWECKQTQINYIKQKLKEIYES